MKKKFPSHFFKVSLALAGLTFFSLLGVSAGFTNWFDNSEFSCVKIFFRSWESKTVRGEPVYNTVKYFKKTDREIWMMNQSHYGLHAAEGKIDRLAIVIKDKSAQFYQLPPGELEWSNDLILQKIDLKVDCMQCHSNGPRAMRPAPDFRSLMSLEEKASLFLLNVRIKFYGHLESKLWMRENLLPENNFVKINSQTCLHCHNNGHQPWSRAELTLEQRDTIRFLIGNKQMPPLGFHLSDEEKQKLAQQLNR